MDELKKDGRGSAGKNNLPYTKLDQMMQEDKAVGYLEATNAIRKINYEKPKDICELQNRIDDMFNFCVKYKIRPGTMLLSQFLGVTKMTVSRWSRGEDCEKKWQDTIIQAQETVQCFIETMFLGQQFNPAVGVFAMKNICHWRDNIEVIDERPKGIQPEFTKEEILARIEESIPIDTDCKDVDLNFSEDENLHKGDSDE